MLGKKWKPRYFAVQGESNDQVPSPTLEEPSAASAVSQGQGKEDLPVKKKKSKKDQQLSTKGSALPPFLHQAVNSHIHFSSSCRCG